MVTEKAEMSFLEHLGVLRGHLIRSVIAIFIFTVLAFLNKNFLFDRILLASKEPDIILIICLLSTKIKNSKKTGVFVVSTRWDSCIFKCVIISISPCNFKILENQVFIICKNIFNPGPKLRDADALCTLLNSQQPLIYSWRRRPIPFIKK